MLTLRPLRWRHLPWTLLPRGAVENDSSAVIVGDGAVDRQRLGARRASGSCCNILGVGFVLGIRVAIYASNGIRVVAGARRGLEIEGFD